MRSDKFGFFDFIDRKIYAISQKDLYFAGLGDIIYKRKGKLKVYIIKFKNDEKTYVINRFTFKRALRALEENLNAK